LLIFKVSVNNAWNTSCEVGVKILVEDPQTQKRKHLSSAYLTFVALDENKKPALMPKIIPKTPREKRRFREAEKRRQIRLERKSNRGGEK
ncbi:MAG: acyl-CoA thioesterase, partial [Candidatus Nealsonbacteria bacterium]|nr:acyl-CoA thioesterase [Candidatus Nealsonbacteria bacterium]